MSERGNPETTPQAAGGRAPDVFKRGGWVPMKHYDEDEEVDFAIVGTGAGGATLAAKLSEAGFSVVAFDAGPYWRPLEDFASDEKAQDKLYWTQDRIGAGENPIEFGANNSGRAVGGSTVHFQMVTLRLRPEWFSRESKLGYGRDWPVDWQEMWRYYDEVEDALKISGPVLIPGARRAGAIPTGARDQRRRPRPRKGRKRSASNGRDPARDAFCAARPRASVRLSRLLQDRLLDQRQAVRARHLCSPGARGGCRDPRPRDGRPDRGRQGRPRHGRRLPSRRQWRRQTARNVIVAGYAIETPRLLLHSACPQHSRRARQLPGLVGKGFMVHSNHAVWGVDGRGDPLVQGTAVDGRVRALELRGQGQGFRRRLLPS